jgi:hypothetical protein
MFFPPLQATNLENVIVFFRLISLPLVLCLSSLITSLSPDYGMILCVCVCVMFIFLPVLCLFSLVNSLYMPCWLKISMSLSVFGNTLISLSIFVHFSQKSQIQNIVTFFFHFLYHINYFFYYYSNKKTHYQTKLFLFPIKQFQTFLYFISHQSLLTIQTKIQQHNHLPNTPFSLLLIDAMLT